MWSDNETAIDFLGFQYLVDGITSIIRNERLLPATVGVFGDWGSGKSSLLEMAANEVAEKDEGVLLVSFNGWGFEGVEDAKSALIGTILDEVGKSKNLKGKAVGLLQKLVSRVNWFRVAATTAKYGAAYALAGPVGAGLVAGGETIKQAVGNSAEATNVDEFAEFISPDSGSEVRQAVREFQKDFAELLEETKIKTLVVVIDDLDRCLPDTVIETLEAIKLFLFAPKTVFLIGADERLVKYAVRNRFPDLPGDNVEVGRDYLEKLIQFPFRIPSLDAHEMETYINLLFTQHAPGLLPGEFEKAREASLQVDSESLLDVRFNLEIAKKTFKEVTSELEQNLGIAQRIAPVLAKGLNGNPRQCKRFLNMLMMRKGMGDSKKLELELGVLAKLMLLEYFKPEWFRSLAESQAVENGKPKCLPLLESGLQPSEKSETNLEESVDVDSTLDESYSAWLEDDWMKDWLGSLPKLSKTDLRRYFHFSRDRLGPLSSAVQRMAPAAQEVLGMLLDASKAQRTNGLKKSKVELSPADAAAIFGSLTLRAKQEEELGDEDSAFSTLFEFVAVRTELTLQLISFVGNLPTSRIPVAATVRVAKIAKDSTYQSAGLALLKNWSESTDNPVLAKAASKNITRVKKG